MKAMILLLMGVIAWSPSVTKADQILDIQKFAKLADRDVRWSKLAYDGNQEAYQRMSGEALTRAKWGCYGSISSVGVGAAAIAGLAALGIVGGGLVVGGTTYLVGPGAFVAGVFSMGFKAVSVGVVFTLLVKGELELVSMIPQNKMALVDPKTHVIVQAFSLNELNEKFKDEIKAFDVADETLFSELMRRSDEADRRINFLGLADLEYVNAHLDYYKARSDLLRMRMEYFERLSKDIRKVQEIAYR